MIGNSEDGVRKTPLFVKVVLDIDKIIYIFPLKIRELLKGEDIMADKIYQSSITEINKVDQYERFFHSKAYLNKKLVRIKIIKNKRDQIKQLAEKSGYNHINNFVKHRKEWHQMNGDIPRKYLKAIGVKVKVLRFTVELDQTDYDMILQLPLYPEFGIIRMDSNNYRYYKFPPETTEKEAIDRLREYAQKINKQCFINFPHIKTIIFRTDGTVYKIYYNPDIDITSDYVIPSKSGDRIRDDI